MLSLLKLLLNTIFTYFSFSFEIMSKLLRHIHAFNMNETIDSRVYYILIVFVLFLFNYQKKRKSAEPAYVWQNLAKTIIPIRQTEERNFCFSFFMIIICFSIENYFGSELGKRVHIHRNINANKSSKLSGFFFFFFISFYVYCISGEYIYFVCMRFVR